VYRALDTRLGRAVAIKVLAESFAGDGDRLRRFEQEAQAVAALNHPNILAIHDVGEQNGAPYLVSELLEGNSLRVELEQDGLGHEKQWITRCRWRKAWRRRTRKISFIAI
jgi:serine/threonine protein kinase